jgi:hypothetical protein
VARGGIVAILGKENSMKQEVCVSNTKYLIDDGDQGFKLQGQSYFKFFKIYKDSQRWPSIEIGVTDPVIEGWKISDKIEDFLSKISPYIIKIGIYKNEIGGVIKKFLLSQTTVNSKEPSLKRLSVCENEAETIEHYRNLAEDIDKPRIGFC